jgi:hypothetical protein
MNISRYIVSVSLLQMSTDCSKSNPTMRMGIPESFKGALQPFKVMVLKTQNGNLPVMVVEIMPPITIKLPKLSADKWIKRLLLMERDIHGDMLELNMYVIEDPPSSGQTISNAMALKTTLISALTHMTTPVVPVKVSRYFVPINKT